MPGHRAAIPAQWHSNKSTSKAESQEQKPRLDLMEVSMDAICAETLFCCHAMPTKLIDALLEGVTSGRSTKVSGLKRKCWVRDWPPGQWFLNGSSSTGTAHLGATQTWQLVARLSSSLLLYVAGGAVRDHSSCSQSWNLRGTRTPNPWWRLMSRAVHHGALGTGALLIKGSDGVPNCLPYFPTFRARHTSMKLPSVSPLSPKQYISSNREKAAALLSTKRRKITLFLLR